MNARPATAPQFGRLAAAGLLVAGSLAFAAGARPSAAQENGDDGRRDPNEVQVYLQESAGRALANDRVVAYLRAEQQGLDPVEVQGEVNRLMQAGLEAARAVEGVRASTEGYAVYYREDERRWVGQQRLRLDAGDPGRLLPLVGDLQEQGFLMDGLDSYLSPDAADAVTDELTAETIRRLQERARRVAETLGLNSVRLTELHLGGAGEPPPEPLRAMAMESRAATADMAPPAFEAGETRVEVRATATAVLSP